jgi:release factor glutamine methyltransferase
MKPNVLDYEPSTALFVPDDDPLKFYRKIAELFSSPRREGVGRDLYLFFEINEHFSDEIEILLQSHGYQNIRIHRDIYGKPRIIDCRMC